MSQESTKADIERRIEKINRRSATPVEYQSNVNGYKLIDADTFTSLSHTCQSKREFETYLRGIETGLDL